MERLIELSTEADWDKLLAESSEKPLLVFKHSTRCPVSADAHEQYQQYLKQPLPGVAYAYVDVIESRPVSNRIAETLHVKHESPQAILVYGGRAVWHDSHWRLTAEAMHAAIRDHAQAL